MNFGLDFGTTNTVLAWRDADGQLQRWQLPLDGALHDTYRSVLYIEPAEDARGTSLASWGGPAAIAEYNRYGESGRLLQSLKSHLASPHFTGTQIFGKSFTLAQLVARFLGCLKADAAASGIALGSRLTIGRPVRFVGEGADEALALERLQAAFTQAGFSDCQFVAEPIAAAYEFARRTDRPGRVFIADLGGGTSDFAIVDIVTPGLTPALQILATGGVGIAGDDLDATIISRIVAPQLGQGGMLKNGQPVPQWLYDYVRRWHHLSFLRTPQNLSLIRDLISEAAEPQPLELLLQLITDNQGFALAQSVGAVKQELSHADQAVWRFSLGVQELKADVAKVDFDTWIAPLVQKIGDAAAATLASAGLVAGDIDHIFMTGGTSYVPAVRQLFTALFSRAALQQGDELTSVAAGLALFPSHYRS